MIRSFRHDLAIENADTRNESLWETMGRLFPDAMGHEVTIGEKETQKKGIDAFIFFDSKRTVTLDFKFRPQKYTDFCLEFEHRYDDGRTSVGWVADEGKRCHFIAYVFKLDWTCWLLPTLKLRAAWSEHGLEWRKRHGGRSTQNDGYKTIWCPVPITAVSEALGGVRVANQKRSWFQDGTLIRAAPPSAIAVPAPTR